MYPLWSIHIASNNKSSFNITVNNKNYIQEFEIKKNITSNI